MKPRERRYLTALFRESSDGRGRVSERSLLDAVLLVGPSFQWFVGARMATAEEDGRGIDVVVTCSDGELYLQSKSSNARALDFRNTRKGKRIAAVAVSLNDEITRARAMTALEEAYGKREVADSRGVNE